MLRFNAQPQDIGYTEGEVEHLLAALGYEIGAPEVEARPRLNLYRKSRLADEVDIAVTRRGRGPEGQQVEYTREFRSVGLPASMAAHAIQLDLIKGLLRQEPRLAAEKVVLTVNGTRYEIACLLGQDLSGMVMHAARRGLDLLDFHQGTTLRQAVEIIFGNIRVPAMAAA